MEREIPQNSFVITKKIDENSINIGDTIAYERKDKIIVTHKVVRIIENCAGSEFRGFETKGTENTSNDPNTVLSPNVIGVVVYCAPGLAAALVIVQWIFVFFVAALIIVIITVLFMRRSNKKNPPQSSKPTHKGGATVAL